MQDEASELEYRARVEELRDRLRASSSSEGDAAAARLYSTSSSAVLQSPNTDPPPVFSFRASQLELPVFLILLEMNLPSVISKLLLIMPFRLHPTWPPLRSLPSYAPCCVAEFCLSHSSGNIQRMLILSSLLGSCWRESFWGRGYWLMLNLSKLLITPNLKIFKKFKIF